MNLPIIDLHTCIQGEGKYAGVPNILVRLSGCNLNCQFRDSLCDTAYASWEPEAGKYTWDDVDRIIKENPHIHQVFFTGGEPTIHGKLLPELEDRFSKAGFLTAIESNGTRFIALPEHVFVTLSPKLSNSTPKPDSVTNDKYIGKQVVTEARREKHESTRKNYDEMKQWITNHEYQLKFVISNESEIEEALKLVDTLEADKQFVYFMPEGDRPEFLNKRRPWLVEKCIDLGINYTDRIQIMAFGNKRHA